ncbi:MAG TPA: DUF5667 domain-containing protein [Actinocrinis sp.]|nr:DUF5667 domain-containing protein [Actinocrinis sp.]
MASLGERRLAEEFDLALDRAADRRQRSAPTAAPMTALVAVARRLGEADRELPGMDEAFRAQLRERLVRLTPELAAAPSRLPGQRGGRHAGVRRPGGAHANAARPGSGKARGGDSGGDGGSSTTRPLGLSAAWRRRLLAAGVGVAVATGSVGGIAVASAGAQPGDPLYSAKKMFESIQLELSGSPTDRGEQYLKLADTRLSEIDNLLSRPDADVPGSPTAAYLAQALNDLNTMIGDGGALLVGQVRATGDQDALHALSDFLLTERQRVADLTWHLPPPLQGQPARVVALMDDLYQQLQQAAASSPQAGTSGPAPSPGQHGGGAVGTGPSAHGGKGAGASADGAASGHASAAGGPSPSASSGQNASPSESPSAITVNLLPLPILPSTSVDVPPLLGLPGINLGLGGGSNSSPTP